MSTNSTPAATLAAGPLRGDQTRRADLWRAGQFCEAQRPVREGSRPARPISVLPRAMSGTVVSSFSMQTFGAENMGRDQRMHRLERRGKDPDLTDQRRQAQIHRFTPVTLALSLRG